MTTLADLLSSRVKAEIFRLLFGIDGQELHVREMARRAGLAEATVRQELRRLSRLGVVEARKDGNRTCYRANVSHPLHPDIRNLVLKTDGLVGVLREALGHEGVRLAFVFGSLAGGTERASSDVDLMVIGRATLRDVSGRLGRVSGTLGREVNPHVLTPGEFMRRRKAREHFLTRVLDSPRLFVIGRDDELEGLGR